MAIRLGDTAPDFTAETTEGTIELHKYLGDSWGVLFSHPKDYTPVCTTELGRVANLKNEFDILNKIALYYIESYFKSELKYYLFRYNVSCFNL